MGQVGTSWAHPGISWDVKGHLRPGTLGIVLGGTSEDIPGTSRDIPGCEGTFETWDFGHCSRWDKSGHPGTSRDVKGHLRPVTLGIVLGGTSRDILGSSGDILGCEGTFETWDFGHCSRWDK